MVMRNFIRSGPIHGLACPRMEQPPNPMVHHHFSSHENPHLQDGFSMDIPVVLARGVAEVALGIYCHAPAKPLRAVREAVAGCCGVVVQDDLCETLVQGQHFSQNDPSRSHRTHEVPFIAGCSHFTRKNATFRAPASSPNQV